jgi:NhaP-type Na+/H+ or K+/H+ antiporter
VESLTWQIVLYAVLSLTVIRMVPVALALVGSGLSRPTVALVGWFGPRGLASVVFALLALEELGNPAARHAVAVITVTVLISVVAHGATADPLAIRYAWLLARQADEHASATVPGLPDRRLIRRVVRAHRTGDAEGGTTGSGVST